MNTTLSETLQILSHDREALANCLPRLGEYLAGRGRFPLSYHPGWLAVLADGLGHTPYCLEATEAGVTRGFLALAFLRSPLFGRFLVSLPYLNYGGPVADDPEVASRLVDGAVELAKQHDVRYLELRLVDPVEHPSLGESMTEKVLMQLPLPTSSDALWKSFSPKVRNQIRKGQGSGLTVAWGGHDVLPEFHDVFSRNMRDLGTPSYGRTLFRSILRQFEEGAEFCVVRAEGRAIASALLLHGRGITEVPSASSLRSFNHTNANMLMYWSLLERAIERGQEVFDFGRSSRDSNTYRFKKQWGALPTASVWQYNLRHGSLKVARPDNPRYQRMIRLWQRMPVRLTRLVGPLVVRGIP